MMIASCWEAIVLVFKGIVLAWIILQLYLIGVDSYHERKHKK